MRKSKGVGTMKREELKRVFSQVYGTSQDARTYFSPGRVNLIGEHTDYNGGHVFPCALTIGTYGMIKERTDRKLRFYSMNFEETGVIESSLDQLVYEKEALWTNYLKGVMWVFKLRGYNIKRGFDILLYGNIPNGSGLSSSASVELLTAYFLKDFLKHCDLSRIELAQISQYAENNFNNVNCGIMDQFAISMGKKNCGIFLNTKDLSYEYAPLHLDGYKIVIASSNKKRGLADSKYNERRAQCEEALHQLQKVSKISSLGELSIEEFERIKNIMEDETLQRRAKHAVYENQRTIEGLKSLESGDLEHFGELMNASHKSLREDYEVTGIELDTLAHSAWETDGVLGSRMTGAGFGGCTVSIVREKKVEDFIIQVGRTYKEKIGYEADFYVVEAGDGVRAL